MRYKKTEEEKNNFERLNGKKFALFSLNYLHQKKI